MLIETKTKPDIVSVIHAANSALIRFQEFSKECKRPLPMVIDFDESVIALAVRAKSATINAFGVKLTYLFSRAAKAPLYICNTVGSDVVIMNTINYFVHYFILLSALAEKFDLDEPSIKRLLKATKSIAVKPIGKDMLKQGSLNDAMNILKAYLVVYKMTFSRCELISFDEMSIFSY